MTGADARRRLDVPTVAEAGLPGYEINPGSVCLRRRQPTEIVAKLSDEITRILNMPDVRSA